MTTTTVVNINAVRESPTNPRKHFDEAKLQELAKSIGTQGLLQQILVRPLNGANKYECVAGHRRLRAAKIAGLEVIPANIRELTDHEVIEIQLSENIHRDDLTPLEEADSYRAILDAGIMSAEDIAMKLGRSRSHIYGRLKLAELGPKARKALEDGKLQPSTALLIARLPAGEVQEEALETVLRDSWDGSPVSYRHAAEILDHFLLVLKEAPFDTKSTEIVPAAGACTTCPKRTGAQPELFPEVKSTNVCTDRACYESKVAAHSKRVVADARAKGLTVLEGKAADKARYGSAFVNPDDNCWDDPKHRTYKQLIGKAAPEPTILVDKNGATQERWPAKAVAEALKAAGHTKAARASASDDAAAKRAREQAALRNRVQDAMYEELVTGIGNGDQGDDVFWQAVARLAVRFAWADVRSKVARRRGLNSKNGHEAERMLIALASGLESSPAKALVIELLANHDIDGLAIRDLLRAGGWTPQAIESAVKAKVKAEKQEKKAAQGKARPKAAKHGKAKSKKAPTKKRQPVDDDAPAYDAESVEDFVS
jgi:ParB/RepB/Spo0J family partition protein